MNFFKKAQNMVYVMYNLKLKSRKVKAKSFVLSFCLRLVSLHRLEKGPYTFLGSADTDVRHMSPDMLSD